MINPFEDETTVITAPSLTFRIWMAGDYDDARRVIRTHCSEKGACFSISPTDYIYSGGEEQGFCVTLINYPRYPASENHLEFLALEVADKLLHQLNQSSYTLEGPNKTSWFSRRKQ